jgi:Sec7-like guanine-nucleotide exchange factor
MVEKFAEKYVSDNPEVFECADAAYVLAFSIIMLHTDMYNPTVKKKMTFDDFKRIN